MKTQILSIAIFLMASISHAHESDTIATFNLPTAEVVGTRIPLPQGKTARITRVMTHEDIESASVNSVNDLLKLVSGIDVRQRGAFGIQTDIGLNGGNEDQLTVLLNGIPIGNPQTGHHTFLLPVNPDDIERIEIVEGGASRVYGSQAFSGAVNIVTKSGRENTASIHLQGGSYGTFAALANASLATLHTANRIGGGYTRSDGGSSNDDFRKGNAFWSGQYDCDRFQARIQAGFSNIDYGANTFYGTGSNSQYEENDNYHIAARAEYKSKIHVPVQLWWNHALDHYVWQRANPSAYQNFHKTDVYGGHISAYTTWALGKTAIGTEFRRENILSTRLGKEIPEAEQHKYKVPGHDAHYKYKDGRSDMGIYMEHDVVLRQLTLSLGVIAHHNTSVPGGLRFYPGIDLSLRATDHTRLFASFNQSLRTPTFTDLYYNGPGLMGNSALKAEKSSDWHLGVDHTGSGLHTQARVYFQHGTDMIDWVKLPQTQVYTTTNSNTNTLGAEALLNIDFTQLWSPRSPLRSLSFNYCYNYKYRTNQAASAIYVNSLTFLRHKFVAILRHKIVTNLSAQWCFTLKNREGEFDHALSGTRQSYGTFGTLDLKLQWTHRHGSLYLQANNLTNHSYYDYANVRQAGIWLMAGSILKL